MGNNSRSPEDYDLVSKYREQDWIRQWNEEGSKIWRNRFTREAVEVIRLQEIPSIEDMDVYSFRMMENDLIKVYQIALDNNYDLCTNNQFAQLLVEYIPIRLINIRNFDREEALTILSAALRAFHLLEIKFGPIIPAEDLIGFNEQGKAKIWINRNSCINYVDKRVDESSQNCNVSERVKRLFEMIEVRAKYVLLPPIIREQIHQPFVTYLSALKVLEKFAYYEKLNLRKYLHLGHQRVSQPQQPQLSQVNHRRRTSNLTQQKQSNRICCERNDSSFYDSGIKQPAEFRRIYSVNSIHNNSINSSVRMPMQIPRRGEQISEKQFPIKHSIMSNSSHIQSVRPPSSVNFTHVQVVNISAMQQVRSNYHREGPTNLHKTLETTIENAPNKSEEEFKVEEEEIHQVNDIQAENQLEEYLSKRQERQEQERQEKQEIIQADPQQQSDKQIYVEPQQKVNSAEIALHHQPQLIIDKIKPQSEDENESITPHKEIGFIQQCSPTFVGIPQLKCELLSFGPSQQNLQEKNEHKLNEKEFIKKLSEQQQRRLSIQNKNEILEFAPNFIINPISILNYCTSVESKLHMATNREHSIIDPKKQQTLIEKYNDEQIEQYIRDKYHNYSDDKPQYEEQVKVERVYSKYESLPNKATSSKLKPPPNPKLQTYLKRNEGEQDFLDVNFLEKSLDKRYSNIENQIKLQSKKRELEENDALNIAKLEEGLQKFSMSQQSQKNADPNAKAKQPISKKHYEYGNLQESQLFDNRNPPNVQQYSTEFEGYYPFREKKVNEGRQPEDNCNEKVWDYSKPYQQGSSKYIQDRYGQYLQHYYHQEDNKHEYSFDGSNPYVANSSKLVSKSYTKEPYPSSNQYQTSQAKSKKKVENYSSTSSLDAKQPQNKQPSSTRKISYEQLRQFLWN